MDTASNLIIHISLWDFLRLVIHLISLGVLIFWFMKSRKRTLDGVLFVVGILLHLYALFFVFGSILNLYLVKYLFAKVIFVPGSKWTSWYFHTFLLLYCFMVWLGLTLILKHKELRWKRFLGILPLMIILMILAEPFIFGTPFSYFLLLLPIIVGVVMIIFHGFKDRISFQGLLIAVTHLEPVGPAIITNETRIKIRGTEDPVILNCPHCGAIQEEIRETCSNCSNELPIKILK